MVVSLCITIPSENRLGKDNWLDDFWQENKTSIRIKAYLINKIYFDWMIWKLKPTRLIYVYLKHFPKQRISMSNAAAFGIGCNNLLGRNDSFCSHPIEDLGRFVPSVLYIFIKPSQLLPQYMLHTFPGPVAMILKGQQHQPGSPSRTAYGLEENFGLKR